MADYNQRDVKFVREMIPHHQMAVNMAASIYSNGQNQQIKDMALRIYSAQKDEIEKFQKWLKDRGLST